MLVELVEAVIEILTVHEKLVFFFGVVAFLSNVNVIAFWHDHSFEGKVRKGLFSVAFIAVLCLNILPALSCQWMVFSGFSDFSKRNLSEIENSYELLSCMFLSVYGGVLFLCMLLSKGFRKLCAWR